MAQSPTMRIFVSILLLSIFLGSSEGFVPASQNRGVLNLPNLRASSTTSSTRNKDERNDDYLLPPGRPTPRFFGFLFDDTLPLLNPRSMGSYQVKRKNEYGDIFKTNIFFGPAAVMVGQSTMKALANQEAKSNGESSAKLEACFPPHHQKLFGTQSLIVQSGSRHAQLRRLVQPSLSPASMKSFQPTIDVTLESFFERLLETYPKGKSFAVVPEIRDFFIEIALNILLGTASSYSKEEISVLAKDISIWSKGLLSPPLTFIPWSTAAKAMRARKRVAVKLRRLIEEERSRENSSNSLLGRLCAAKDDESDENNNKSGSSLSTEAIIDNVLTLIFAGSDTTASAATSMWMVLSQRPDVKQKLQSNPDELIPLFVSKILQMYPPAPFSMRVVKDNSIQIGDYVIPPGWLVVYGIAGVLHEPNPSPDWIEESEQQQQDTSSKTNAKNNYSSPESSVAFGGGPRMCPGRYLATLELATLCRKLVLQPEKFGWSLVPDQNLEQQYTPGFFPKDGLQIQFC